jgi:hypothetical protein
MKKLLLFAVLIGFGGLAKAQDYGVFKVDLGLGYAQPSSGGGTKAGAEFTVEPHYRLSDDFAVGVRIEIAAIGREDSQGNFNFAALGSYCATGEYYLMNGGFRPFIGAGVGLFDQESVVNKNNNTNGSGYTTSPQTVGFGAFPEIGFEAGHFRLSIEYNIVGSNNSYAAIGFGAFFGGGKR